MPVTPPGLSRSVAASRSIGTARSSTLPYIGSDEQLNSVSAGVVCHRFKRVAQISNAIGPRLYWAYCHLDADALDHALAVWLPRDPRTMVSPFTSGEPPHDRFVFVHPVNNLLSPLQPSWGYQTSCSSSLMRSSSRMGISIRTNLSID